ncbi:Dyp-type peroxidase [Halomicroarcula sp. F13]|uniref:Dyp-type peroxidase n=1 Tax=Haloarcula rubra TaxID=2487747 RepID=A0AAW4PP52_9EURY|nr:Dyp-type peroxidase [Halomicroarcula rubra]MBX0322213.1 Dyp-type peroxidase [Halomicroarcula rubra]
MPSRRALLYRLATLTGAAGLSGCSNFLARRAESPTADLPPNPHAGDLPQRQFAWNDGLRTDSDGNSLSPEHFRLLLLNLDTDPSEEAARTVELAMRTLEDAFEFRSDGLLHMLGWGTAYFERLGRLGDSPIRHPTVVSRTDDPELLSYDAILVLASDVPSQLEAAESAMFGTRSSLGGVTVEQRLGDAFTLADRRTGFLGEGLPAQHANAEGVPNDIPDDAPNFTGFFSGRTGTQASEERVTISDGRYAGGTTMHLSHLRESLDNWWAMPEADRVTQMFSSEFSPEDVAGNGPIDFADAVTEHAQETGRVGHWEKVARARKDDEPLLLRRDFNSVDGGHAAVQFLSVQRTLDDFVETRDAMNGWWLQDEHPDIQDERHNGILEFIEVLSRANFYVPPRDRRAFPDA